MHIELETRRRALLPLLALGLAALYLFVFMPLNQSAAKLDGPLDQSWKKLAAALGQTNTTRINFAAITNQFNETRTASVAVDKARKLARARVRLDDDLRNRLGEPFQLVDYDYASGRLMDQLGKLAAAQKVTLEPGVFGGFPEPRADMTEPALLWAELHFIESLLTSAINAKVGVIHSVSAMLPAFANTNYTRVLAELPVQLELTGTSASVAGFLQTVPLRGDEIKAAGLPEAPTNKPALFIDRIQLRKQAPEKPDEVRLMVRVVGFVFRDF
jgi:hypothetical protein